MVPASPRAASRRGLWWSLGAVALVGLLLCVGGGLYGFFNWVRPQEHAAQLQQVQLEVGAPGGFTPGAGVLDRKQGVMVLNFSYTCPTEPCRSHPEVRISDWLRNLGMSNVSTADVESCLTDSVNRNNTCDYRWEYQLCAADASTKLEDPPNGPLQAKVVFRVRDCRWEPL